jgi:hypothetical protein
LAWTLRGGLNPEPLVLPTVPDGNGLALNEDEAEPILDQLR